MWELSEFFSDFYGNRILQETRLKEGLTDVDPNSPELKRELSIGKFTVLVGLLQCVFEPQHDKTNKMNVHLAKTQISLGICPVWSESLLCTQWVAKDSSFLHADSEDSNQTGRMPRLIWVLAGHTAILLVLSCHSSFIIRHKWAKSWENLIMSYVNNKGTDQSAHLRRLISAFVVPS